MNNTKLSLLYNPFTKIAGWSSLWIGLSIMILTAFIGSLTHIVFDGVLDCHIAQVDWLTSIILTLLDWAILLIVIYFGTLFLKIHYRLIDLAGTLALSRAPFLILSILGVITQVTTREDLITQNFHLPIGNIIFICVSIAILIWYITLVYHAIKVSLNLKGRYLTLLLIMGLLIAEVIVVFIKNKWIF